MNIDKMRNTVIQGQIATLKAQIETWNIYSKRTGEDVTNIISQINTHITSLQTQIVTIP